MDTNYTPINVDRVSERKSKNSATVFLVILVFLTAFLAVVLFFMIQKKESPQQNDLLLNPPAALPSNPTPTLPPTIAPTEFLPPIPSASPAAISIFPENQATVSPTLP